MKQSSNNPIFNGYQNYFKDHYKAEFTREWLVNESRFAFNQYAYINKFIDLSSFKEQPSLEIGCGAGRWALILQEHDHSNYTGIDLDKDAIDFVSSELPYKFTRESLDSFDVKSNHESFECIYSFEVLEHMQDPLRSIAAINRLLRDRGYFIGTTPYPFAANINCDNTHLFVLHPLNWRRLFEVMGFEIIACKPMTFLPMLWRLNKRFNFVIPFYIGGLKLVSTTLLVCRKRDSISSISDIYSSLSR